MTFYITYRGLKPRGYGQPRALSNHPLAAGFSLRMDKLDPDLTGLWDAN